MIRKLFFIVVASLLLGLYITHSVFAQTASPTPSVTGTPDNSAQISDLQNKINDLENKISDLQGQEKTLSSQIAVMDTQINLTQLRIESTQSQIAQAQDDIQKASTRISTLQGSLDNLTKVLLNRIVKNYEVGMTQPIQVMLTAQDATDFLRRQNYLRIAQEHDQHLAYDTLQAKNDYANQKNIFEQQKQRMEALQAQLQSYTDQLDGEKKAKQDLLTETQGSESNYQQQLSQYKAQLASLSNFATSRAGSGGGIIAHEDLSDSWGKYFNQRDANWGGMNIGLSSEQVWEVGCLMTSYAMVVSHFGGSVTPADVASNTDNFALGTAYFKLPGPDANGHSAQYITNPSVSSLQNAVKNGNPVIAGLSSNGGPYPQHYSDHWVVLRGVNSDGSFIINDPWYPGAMNVNMNDHYAGWTIIEARIYN